MMALKQFYRIIYEKTKQNKYWIKNENAQLKITTTKYTYTTPLLVTSQVHQFNFGSYQNLYNPMIWQSSTGFQVTDLHWILSNVPNFMNNRFSNTRERPFDASDVTIGSDRFRYNSLSEILYYFCRTDRPGMEMTERLFSTSDDMKKTII
jgi:hypothetical protein